MKPHCPSSIPRASKISLRAGELVQLVKCWPCKREDLKEWRLPRTQSSAGSGLSKGAVSNTKIERPVRGLRE